jgi:hypothetical protein
LLLEKFHNQPLRDFIKIRWMLLEGREAAVRSPDGILVEVVELDQRRFSTRRAAVHEIISIR